MSESLPDSPHSRRASRHRHRAHRVRFAPVAVLGGVAASAVIALSMSGTLAGFVAQITNNNNTAATGTLSLQESSGGTTCNSNTTGNGNVAAGTQAGNTISCTINKFNGSTTLVPNQQVTASVTMTNTGTSPAASFTLAPGTCSQVLGTPNGGATDACSKFTLNVARTTAPAGSVASGTLSALNTAGAINLGSLAAGASVSYTFTLSFPSTNNNATDNTYQGITVKQDLVWTLTS